MVTLGYKCGAAIGPPYWQNLDSFESDECDAVGIVMFEDGEVRVTECPVCGSEIGDFEPVTIAGWFWFFTEDLEWANTQKERASRLNAAKQRSTRS